MGKPHPPEPAPPPELDQDATQRQLFKIARARPSVVDGLRALGAWCQARRPHRDWARAARLPWAGEARRLRRWAHEVLELEPPADTITGLWFGLFTPLYDDSDRPQLDYYVCGNRWRADASWPASPRWWPEHRYAGSSTLARLYDLANADEEAGLGADLEWCFGLGFMVLALPGVFTGVTSDPPRVIATGFDSGEVIELGRVGSGGFAPKLVIRT